MALRKSIFLLVLFALLSCKSLSSSSKDSQATIAPPPLKWEMIDLNGTILPHISLKKTYEQDRVNYKFTAGSCAQAEGVDKVYFTYSKDIVIPTSATGSCKMELQECTDSVCSIWEGISFNISPSTSTSGTLKTLLRTQYNFEQELQTLATTVTSKLKEASTQFDTCKGLFKNANDLNILKSFAEITAQELSLIFNYDFSQESVELMKKIAGSQATSISTTVVSNITGISVTNEELLQLLALGGIPVILVSSISAGYGTYEIYQWYAFIKNERTDGTGRKLVRHKSGFLTYKENLNLELGDLLADTVKAKEIFMDDPGYKTVFRVKDRNTFQPVTEFAKIAKQYGYTYKKGVWRTANGSEIYFERQNNYMVPEDVGDVARIRFDEKLHGTRINSRIYSKQTNVQLEVPSTKVARAYQIPRSHFDPHEGGLLNRLFGTKGKIFLVVVATLGATIGLTRLGTSFGLAEGSDSCNDMIADLKDVLTAVKKAKTIKEGLLLTKMQIQVAL